MLLDAISNISEEANWWIIQFNVDTSVKLDKLADKKIIKKHNWFHWSLSFLKCSWSSWEYFMKVSSPNSLSAVEMSFFISEIKASMNKQNKEIKSR